jgi:LPS-assembly lipoprotein
MRLISFCLTCFLSLTACGFHLRGSYNLPAEIKQLELRISPSSPLSPPLREALQSAGVQLGGGDYTLGIMEDKLSKQTTNTDSRAKAAEYTLYYQVSYRLKNSAGQAVSPERKLLLRRSYQYDTTAIVGKTAEEETLIRELYLDAAQQILRQLGSFKPIVVTP